VACASTKTPHDAHPDSNASKQDAERTLALREQSAVAEGEESFLVAPPLTKEEELRALRDARRQKIERRRTEALRVDGTEAKPSSTAPPLPFPLPEGERREPHGSSKDLINSVHCKTGVCVMSAKLAKEFAGKPDRFSPSANIVPRVRDGQTQGYTLYGVRPGTVPHAVGIRSGDSVWEIDGALLTGPSVYEAAIPRIRPGASFTFLIERKRRLYELVVEFR
jgi:hypothetical protein